MEQLTLSEEITALMQRAEAGNAISQFRLGERFDYGQGVEQSDSKAVEWYRRAAEQGHTDAQFNLGVMYQNGQGVAQSDSTAVEWYRKAAEQGDADAQFNMGVMYQNGQGVEQSDSTAVEWYHKAAEQGYVDAQFNLGVMYLNGQGVTQSDSTAVDWYRKAAEQGYADAQCNLGVMYQHGRGVAQSDGVAAEWYRRAAEQGDADSQFNLGLMYQNGQGVVQSDSAAAEWYHKAAEQGDADAQCNLGWMYEQGLGIAQSDSLAVELYRKAAEQGDADAQCNLGWMYQEGRGVAQSYSMAVEWYLKATEQGLARAQCNMGVMCIKGWGVEQSDRTALDWFRKASEGGDDQGTINLGLSYMHGYGVESNNARAQDLFRQAARIAPPRLRFQAIEFQDQAERYALSPQITKIRERILDQLKVKTGVSMTHYTSLLVGNALLLEQSPLRLGHINALNDPNEGKLLWRHFGYAPVESKPVFVGCFLPEDDSLNMWRFYSKNHQNDDACGCAITFHTDNFFEFDLLSKKWSDTPQDEKSLAFHNTGKSPQESAAFYRVVYVKGDMQIHDDAEGSLNRSFNELTNAVNDFLGENSNTEKLRQLSRLLGPLPYLLKDADYEAEKEHRIIVTHLEYGAKEVQVVEPDLIKGTPPRLFLELHRTNHLASVKHVTLGPKSPNQEMMAPYWHHQLVSKYPDQLKEKSDFCIKASKCAYQ